MQDFQINKKTRNKRKEITKEESDIKKKVNKEKKIKKKSIYAEFQKTKLFPSLMPNLFKNLNYYCELKSVKLP